MLNRRAALLVAQQTGGEMVYVWKATVSEASLDGVGNLSVSSGNATAYTATYTFAQSGNYRLFVIGKGGNGGNGGNGAWRDNGEGGYYKATGGSGGSGAYGACAVYEVSAAAGATLTITYSATSTLVSINGHDITAVGGGNGGDGTSATTAPVAGNGGSAGTGGAASGSNISGGNYSGVAGSVGFSGTAGFDYSTSPIAGPAGAATAAHVVNYMDGDGVAGGISTTGTDRDGNDGAYLRTGALTKLGNPGSGAGGGAASATSANRVGGAGGLGRPGGLVIERGAYV